MQICRSKEGITPSFFNVEAVGRGNQPHPLFLAETSLPLCAQGVHDMKMADTGIGIRHNLVETGIGIRHNLVETDIGIRQ